MKLKPTNAQAKVKILSILNTFQIMAWNNHFIINAPQDPTFFFKFSLRSIHVNRIPYATSHVFGIWTSWSRGFETFFISRFAPMLNWSVFHPFLCVCEELKRGNEKNKRLKKWFRSAMKVVQSRDVYFVYRIQTWFRFTSVTMHVPKYSWVVIVQM